MLAGDQFPPVTLFDTPSGLVVVDGFHRVAAAKAAGLETISAEIHQGTEHEALEYARYTANRKNGQRLSRADVEQIIEQTLRDPQYVSLSDRQLGTLCGCSHTSIGRYRQKLGTYAEVRTYSDGRTLDMATLQKTAAVAVAEAPAVTLPVLHLGDPPAAPEAPADGGHSALEAKVTDRLTTHLDALKTTLARMEFADLGLDDELRPLVEAQAKQIAGQLRLILERGR
jgi:hypothetical protein